MHIENGQSVEGGIAQGNFIIRRVGIIARIPIRAHSHGNRVADGQVFEIYPQHPHGGLKHQGLFDLLSFEK